MPQLGAFKKNPKISTTKLLELIRCYCISRQVFIKGTGSVVILGHNYVHVHSAYMPLAFERLFSNFQHGRLETNIVPVVVASSNI